MTQLPELFEQAVAEPPPSRLSANDVLTTVRHQQRRRAALASAMGVILVGLATVTGAFLVRNAAIPPSGSAPPDSIIWAGRGDADHFYKVVNLCGYNPRFDPSSAPTGQPDLGTDGPSSSVSADPSYQPPPPVCDRLLASTDGGATWVSRGDSSNAYYDVVGPEKLLRSGLRQATASPSSGPQSISAWYELSVDGGATWTDLGPDGNPLPDIPAGAVVLASGSDPGIVFFDNSDNQIHELVHLPPLTGSYTVSVSRDGTVWATGTDSSVDRPAVAVSHNGGHTWTRQFLPNTNAMSDPDFSNDGMYLTKDILSPPVSWDGQTAYVTMYDHDAVMTAPPTALSGMGGCPRMPAAIEDNCWAWFRGFVTHDGGATWTELGSQPSIPSHEWTWVTADSRLVVSVAFPPGPGTVETAGPSPDPTATFATTTDGVHFTLGQPPGFPHKAVLVDARFAYTSNDLYVSDDGWSWRKL